MKLNIDDEQGIEFLHFIFEREFKPPFSKSNKDEFDHTPYYNQDGEEIGWIYSKATFEIDSTIYKNIRYKIIMAFEFPYDSRYWWFVIEPCLKSWLETQLNIELNDIG